MSWENTGYRILNGDWFDHYPVNGNWGQVSPVSIMDQDPNGLSVGEDGGGVVLDIPRMKRVTRRPVTTTTPDTFRGPSTQVCNISTRWWKDGCPAPCPTPIWVSTTSRVIGFSLTSCSEGPTSSRGHRDLFSGRLGEVGPETLDDPTSSEGLRQQH